MVSNYSVSLSENLFNIFIEINTLIVAKDQRESGEELVIVNYPSPS